MGEPRLEAAVFDLGETLVDETSAWSEVADAVGRPRFTFMATLGALIAAGRSHREVFERFGVSDPPRTPSLSPTDLYPDARPCLEELRRRGLRVGIAANQPDRAAEIARIIGVELDLVATSAGWGIDKPSPTFFARIASELALPPASIAYVGDRADNDVMPSAAAGMVAVFVRRGPWAWIHYPTGTPSGAAFTVEDLRALPDLLLPLSSS